MDKPTHPARNAKKNTVGGKARHNSEQAHAGQKHAVVPARDAAFRILLIVEKEKKHSDDLLRTRTVNRLTPADRNLATALVLGVLRWQKMLDAQLQQFLKRPNAKLDVEVRVALRLGAFQLQHMDRIPARAAIDESVELTKSAGHRFASGMVNAVLRRFAALPRESSADAALSAHPAWMVERWQKFYGDAAAQQICEHGQKQPRVALRLTSADSAQATVDLQPGELLTAARILHSSDEALEEGVARIQDEGSQLVAELIGFTQSNTKPKKILDCCAAPGGKTMILAQRNPDAQIIACEVSEPRCADLRKRLEPLGQRTEVRCTDASLLHEKGQYDLVLADVPCSGTGTLGRNPEIRHRLTADDLLRQAERQRAILKAAFDALKPGGRLIYSTCSLEPEENEQVVSAVLGENLQARIVSLSERVEELRSAQILTQTGADSLMNALTPEGYLRLLPGALPTDGFFIAQITR